MSKKIVKTNGMARSINKCFMVKAELLMLEAIQEIETLGADVRLTNAQRLIGDARDLIADYVDEVIQDK